MELITLFRFIEVLVKVDVGSATLSFLTDMPGSKLDVRGQVNIPVTNGRHPFRLGLAATTKGKLYQAKIVPVGASVVRIYSARVYARVLGPSVTPWQWYAVPSIAPTSDEWQMVKLPIPETSDQWQMVKLPIPETSDQWQEMKLPIPETSDQWQMVKLPIPETSDDWQEMKLPVKPTPVVPDWVDLGIDQ